LLDHWQCGAPCSGACYSRRPLASLGSRRQVKRVADLINEISHSTLEQSAAAAESLKGQAVRLVEAVGVFSRQ